MKPHLMPQFVNGDIVMVPYSPEQYSSVKLSEEESKAAIDRMKALLVQTELTVDEMNEALRKGREKKYYRMKTAEYFARVNSTGWLKFGVKYSK